jgi:hypothetical protein
VGLTAPEEARYDFKDKMHGVDISARYVVWYYTSYKMGWLAATKQRDIKAAVCNLWLKASVYTL